MRTALFKKPHYSKSPICHIKLPLFCSQQATKGDGDSTPSLEQAEAPAPKAQPGGRTTSVRRLRLTSQPEPPLLHITTRRDRLGTDSEDLQCTHVGICLAEKGTPKQRRQHATDSNATKRGRRKGLRERGSYFYNKVNRSVFVPPDTRAGKDAAASPGWNVPLVPHVTLAVLDGLTGEKGQFSLQVTHSTASPLARACTQKEDPTPWPRSAGGHTC